MGNLRALCSALLFPALVLAQVLVGSHLAEAGELVQPAAGGFIIQPEADQPSTEIGRGYFTLSLEPGVIRSIRLVAKNTGATPITLRVDAVDSVQIDGGGVGYTLHDKAAENVGTWIQVEPRRLTLLPGEAQRIVATVRVPVNVGPGDHIGGIAVEDENVEVQGGGSLMINVHYRKVLGVVVRAPADSRASLAIGAVSLVAGESGSQAIIDVHNRGNVVLQGAGTIDVGSNGSGTGALPFHFSTLLPGAGTQAVVPLPQVQLMEGSYKVRVELASSEAEADALWEGVALARDPRVEDALPALASQPIASILEHVRTIAPLAQERHDVVPAAVAIAAILAVIALAVLVSRRRYRAVVSHGGAPAEGRRGGRL